MADTELVALWVKHDGPSVSLVLAVLDDLGPERDEASDFLLGDPGGEVDVDSALGGLGLGHLPEQDPADAALVGCSQCSEALLLADERVAGDGRPELGQATWILTVERHVLDERAHAREANGLPGGLCGTIPGEWWG